MSRERSRTQGSAKEEGSELKHMRKARQILEKKMTDTLEVAKQVGS